ncbi:MAG: hypothetical protein K8R60_18110 [Burkholderiales bacterium]|nr:hypothetical protein [Burkholderiales bacterium]
MPVRESRWKGGDHYLLARLVGSENLLRRFLRRYPAEIQGVARKGQSLSLRVTLPASVLARTRGSGVEVLVDLDITKMGAVQAQALHDAQPLQMTRAPLGLATTATRYLLCPEVTAATEKLADDFPNLCTLIESPILKDTLGGAACRALAISKEAPPGAPAILILGGIHGLEWGSCEIALNFVEQLLTAYSAPGTDVTIGPVTITAAEIATLLTTRQIVVFPMVNPDGRAYSQNPVGNSGWRKNRNPAMADPANPLSIGVDINRNFNFLFDLTKSFDPNCSLMVASQPSSDFYQGPCAESEIETSNVLALLDEFPTISWLVDLHSGMQKILRPWSDDDTQSDKPAQSFQDVLGYLVRGRPNDDYGEHMIADDVKEHERLMTVLVDSIAAVNGPTYPQKSAFEFSASSGTSHDFAYSRHLVDPLNRAKILSFVVEWSAVPHPFWLPHMRPIVSEVTAGLFGFAIATQFPLP